LNTLFSSLLQDTKHFNQELKIASISVKRLIKLSKQLCFTAKQGLCITLPSLAKREQKI
jgi:hypothetical protein